MEQYHPASMLSSLRKGPREAAALRDFDPAYVSSGVFRDEGGNGHLATL
jgi:hypothetical protein